MMTPSPTKAARRGAKHLMPLLALLLLCACANPRPGGILSESETVEILTEMMLADAYDQNPASKSLPDSVRKHMASGILAKYGVAQEKLDSTMRWYGANLDEYYLLFDKIDKNLTRLRKNLAKTSPEIKADDNNIWNLPDHLWFTPLGSGSAFVFELPGTAVTKGERLEFKMHFSKISEVQLTLGVDYKDETIGLSERTFRGDKSLSLILQTDTSKIVSRIFGTVMLKPNALPMYADSIKLLKSPWDSLEYSNQRYRRIFYGPHKWDNVPKDTIPGNINLQPSESSTEEATHKRGTPSSPQGLKRDANPAFAPTPGGMQNAGAPVKSMRGKPSGLKN